MLLFAVHCDIYIKTISITNVCEIWVPGKPSTRSPQTMKNFGFGRNLLAAAIAFFVSSTSASHLKQKIHLIIPAS